MINLGSSLVVVWQNGRAESVESGRLGWAATLSSRPGYNCVALQRAYGGRTGDIKADSF